MSTLIDRLPRSAIALVWALAALHWRSGKRYAGATLRGLQALLGTKDRVAMSRCIAQALSAGVVVIAVQKDAKNRTRRNVLLTHATLTQLEDLWLTRPKQS